MVEYQCGSSDIIQSIDANVMVRPIRRSPPRESSSRRSVGCGSVVVSCASDQRVRARATTIQTAK